ncbi:MAG: DUF1624 domain-containing protein, partial [Paracoccaceae bacterium]
FAMVAGASLVVSIASLFIFPDAPILFGILHCIATASLIGLATLRLPAVFTLALAAAAFLAPGFATSPAFSPTFLVWTGLGATRPVMVDYVPLLPWLAPFLAGIAIARLADRAGLWNRLRQVPSRLQDRLAFPGRHSLVIYLIHQPIMIGGFVAFRWLTAS